MKIYVINLEGREDRLEWSLSQANRFGFQFERYPAISSTGQIFDFVTPNVGACFESHKKVWQLLVDSDQEFGLILEDDFDLKKIDFEYLNEVLQSSLVDFIQIGFLTTGFRDKLNLFLTNLKHLLLLTLKLCATKLNNQKILNRVLIMEISTSFPRLVPSDFRAGAHAYIISRKMAGALNGVNDPIFLATDDFFIALARMRAFRIFRLFNSICGQTSLPSSIKSRFKIFD